MLSFFMVDFFRQLASSHFSIFSVNIAQPGNTVFFSYEATALVLSSSIQLHLQEGKVK